LIKLFIILPIKVKKRGEEMKKMKKKLIWGLVLILGIVTFSGCGEKATAESIIEQMLANVEKVESAEGKISAEIAISVSQAISGVNMDLDIEMDIDMDFEMTKDPAASHLAGTMSASIAGQSMDMTMESYEVVEDGMTVEYSYSSETDTWTRTEAEDAESSESYLEFSDFSAEDFTLNEETEDVDGTEAYVLTATLSGDSLESFTGGTLSDAGDGLAMGDMEAANLSADVKLYVDKNEMMPLRMSLDFSNSEVDLFEDSELEGSELNTFMMEISYTEFDLVDTIEVPQEVIDEAAQDEGTDETEGETVTGAEITPNESGEYIIYTEDQTASMAVGTPEGYQYSYSSADYGYVAFSDGKSIDVSYMIYDGYTSEDLAAEYEFTSEWMSAEDEENYQNVVLNDVQTVALGDKEVSYRKMTYDFVSGEMTYPCIDYSAWVVEDGISYIVRVEVFGDESGTVDDSIVDKVFSVINFE